MLSYLHLPSHGHAGSDPRVGGGLPQCASMAAAQSGHDNRYCLWPSSWALAAESAAVGVRDVYPERCMMTLLCWRSAAAAEMHHMRASLSRGRLEDKCFNYCNCSCRRLFCRHHARCAWATWVYMGSSGIHGQQRKP